MESFQFHLLLLISSCKLICICFDFQLCCHSCKSKYSTSWNNFHRDYHFKCPLNLAHVKFFLHFFSFKNSTDQQIFQHLTKFVVFRHLFKFSSTCCNGPSSCRMSLGNLKCCPSIDDWDTKCSCIIFITILELSCWALAGQIELLNNLWMSPSTTATNETAFVSTVI